MQREINEFEDLHSLINMACPDLREITFHSDGRVIAKTGGKAKHPKKIYSAKPKIGDRTDLHYGWSELAIEALQKLIKDNQ